MSYDDALAEREANLRALNEELDTRIQTVATLSSSSSSSITAFAPSPLSFDLGEGDGDGIEEQQQQQLPSFSSSSAAFNNLKQVASPQKDTSHNNNTFLFASPYITCCPLCSCSFNLSKTCSITCNCCRR
jgi:hypothetical protein